MEERAQGPDPAPTSLTGPPWACDTETGTPSLGWLEATAPALEPDRCHSWTASLLQPRDVLTRCSCPTPWAGDTCLALVACDSVHRLLLQPNEAGFPTGLDHLTF